MESFYSRILQPIGSNRIRNSGPIRHGVAPGRLAAWFFLSVFALSPASATALNTIDLEFVDGPLKGSTGVIELTVSGLSAIGKTRVYNTEKGTLLDLDAVAGGITFDETDEEAYQNGTENPEQYPYFKLTRLTADSGDTEWRTEAILIKDGVKLSLFYQESIYDGDDGDDYFNSCYLTGSALGFQLPGGSGHSDKSDERSNCVITAIEMRNIHDHEDPPIQSPRRDSLW